MVDLVNNVVALRINSRDRINISDPTTNFTIALKKSLRNIAAINVAGVVIPRNDTLIGPNNDTLTGVIQIDDIVNPFEVSIVRTNYTAATLATELAAKLNADTDMLSYGITFAISHDPIVNRMNIVATYPMGATKTWSITIDYTSLRDVIGIGIAGTTSQTFEAVAGSTTLNITCARTPNLVRALTYNISSNILTNGINTSYISSLGKIFEISSSNNLISIENQFVNGSSTIIRVVPPNITPEIFSQMMIGNTVALSNTGTTMIAGSQKYGVYIFTRSTVTEPWSLMGAGPLRNTDILYSSQGQVVAISGDAARIAFSSFSSIYRYRRSGNSWTGDGIYPASVGKIAFNMDGSTFVHSNGNILYPYLNSASQGAIHLTGPASGIGLSNTGDILITGDSGFGSPVGYVYLRTAGVWALQQTLTPSVFVGGYIDSVAMSGNGLYLAISSSTDNGGVGATWIYNWTGATWDEQQKIVVASSSLAMNIAGDTIVIGGSAGAGKINVYKRSGVSWSIELANYVGTNGISAMQGMSVAITGSGDDIIWSGPNDSGVYGNNQGAIWSAHRTVSTWSQTLDKITSTLGVNQTTIGRSVAMSDDGRTIVIGIPDVDSQSGIAYVYISNGIEWLVQAALNPRPGAGARIGARVAISVDGNTVALSGHSDIGQGGAWIYTRNGAVWTLQANLTSPDSPVLSQSLRLALNGPGNTFVASGDSTNNGLLIWTRSGNVWSIKETALGSGAFSNNQISQIDISNDEAVIVASSTGFGAIIYRLINGTWTADSPNLMTFYTPMVASAQFGTYCCISADGNTVAVSDPGDNPTYGATFIFKYVAGAWSQNAALSFNTPITPSNQGSTILLLRNGDRCIVTSTSYVLFPTRIGLYWEFNYNGVSWTGIPGNSPNCTEFGTSISGQRTGVIFAIGAPNTSYPGGRMIGTVIVYARAGSSYSMTVPITIPPGSYSIFDIVNILNQLMIGVIPTGPSVTGYQVSFDGNSLTIIPTSNVNIQNTFRVSPSSTFTVARWPNQEYKSAQVSNPIVFSINNNVIKSVTTHSDNSDNVLVDNTPDAPYRKYAAGYTIDAGTQVDIQLRNDRDQIIDLNGSDWVMTVYATVRS